MRKFFPVFIPALFILFSCATTKNDLYSQNLSQKYYQIDVSNINVEVDIDYIKNKDIETQVAQVLYSRFSSLKRDTENKFNVSSLENEILFLDIKITQRSFMKDINQYNSIFVCYTVKDKNDNIIIQNCIKKETKGTVISGIEQNKLTDSIYAETEKVLVSPLKDFKK